MVVLLLLEGGGESFPYPEGWLAFIGAREDLLDKLITFRFFCGFGQSGRPLPLAIHFFFAEESESERIVLQKWNESWT